MRGADSARALEAVDSIHIGSLEPVRLGMPELCRAGLSENWLLKVCGHRHWLALAQAYGLERPDFRTAEGERLYPAFTSVRVEDGRLDEAEEGDVLHFAVTLQRTGRTRFRSSIAVTAGDRIVAVLIMETAFVHRTVAGRNRSVSRAMVARPCSLLPPVGDTARPGERLSAARFGQPGWTGTMSEVIDPSPHEDFNGADFLYFAAYQAIVDRAEWRWWHHTPALITRRRDIVYLGNIELGEQLRVNLCGLEQDADRLSHWVEVTAGPDHRLIAFVTTERRISTARAGRRTVSPRR